jgi:hypothetical protein
MLLTARFFAVTWLGYRFDPKNEGSTFVRNIGELPPDYRALNPRAQNSSVMSSQEILCNGGSVLREVRAESMNITSMSFRLQRVKVERD